ncbi:hypothetical protein PR048_008102 [Dryococelus australis]|uniref:Uncharacterized protein n=1 Tax=Dryococelus australis TaxID=614101 RepID=A0ABQ9HX11_9NEOP|nr:hypothetical protein PR048_008102 [Dryococelus australis]
MKNAISLVASKIFPRSYRHRRLKQGLTVSNTLVAGPNELIRQSNNIGCEGGTDAQNSCLSGFISTHPVARRRTRKNKNDAILNYSSYNYKVRVMKESNEVEVPGFNQSSELQLSGYTQLKDFCEQLVNILNIQISYETFRQIFVSEFNIAFGYPRTETCCWCDEQKAKITNLDRKVANAECDKDRITLQADHKKLEDERKFHLTSRKLIGSTKRNYLPKKTS